MGKDLHGNGTHAASVEGDAYAVNVSTVDPVKRTGVSCGDTVCTPAS